MERIAIAGRQGDFRFARPCLFLSTNDRSDSAISVRARSLHEVRNLIRNTAAWNVIEAGC